MIQFAHRCSAGSPWHFAAGVLGDRQRLRFGAAVALMVCLGAPADLASATERSLRSLERLHWVCSSSLGERQVTLFGNGTVRVKNTVEGGSSLHLEELEPGQLDAYLARLAEPKLDETAARYESVGGDWVEGCRLDLDLPEKTKRTFRFGRYDSLSLDLRRIVDIAEEILAEVDLDRPGVLVGRLPVDYEPRIGDVLERSDGVEFRIMSPTADRRGFELQGVVQPLTLYLLTEQLRDQFVAVVRRGRSG